MQPRGNATFRYRDTAIVGLAHIEAPVVVPSAKFDEQLAPIRKRLRLPRNILERISGVRERRWWHRGTAFEDMAAEAGAKALASAGVQPADVGLLINTSVSRSSLEPSVAVQIHDRLGLPSSAMNFDITNACLGFINGIQMAGAMIDAGQLDYALVVNAEHVGPSQEETIARLNAGDGSRETFTDEFASLTLGDGAAAAVVGRASERPDGHRVIGGITRAATENNRLCVGSFGKMVTDTKNLMRSGLELVTTAWNEARHDGWDWAAMTRYVTHQISTPYTESFIRAVGIDAAAVPITFDKWGNVGPASIAMTLSEQAERLQPGGRVLCLGVGSGINTAMLELAW